MLDQGEGRVRIRVLTRVRAGIERLFGRSAVDPSDDNRDESASRAPRPVRLENRSGHRIDLSSDDERVVVIDQIAPPARLACPVAGDEILDVDGARTRIRVFRRRLRPVGLPPKREGVVYAVPSDVAFAARNRNDLLFVHDATQSGPACLARFVRQGMEESGFGLDPVRMPWWRTTTWTAIEFAVATGLLGGAVGNAPDFATWLRADPKPPAGTGTRLIATALVLLFGVIVLAVASYGWFISRRATRALGTAYIVEEIGDGWVLEEKWQLFHALGRAFGQRLFVPGPSELAEDGWRWPLDENARRWDEQLDVLVRSFWSVHYNDDRGTQNAVFMWAPWPVALGFGARTRSGLRGLALNIRQRPSHGRVHETQHPEGWKLPPHVFVRSSEAPALPSAPGRTVRDVDLEVIGPRAMGEKPLLLLIRMTRARWGPFGGLLAAEPCTGAALSARAERVQVLDHSGYDLAWSGRSAVHEWSCPPEQGLHPWGAYPALARAAADWIVEVAHAHPNRPLLVGLVAPQEIALGLGILAQQDIARWPEKVWPIVFDNVSGALVIPNLNLGRRSLEGG